MNGRGLILALGVALLSACGDSYSSGPDNGSTSLTGSYRGTVDGTTGGDLFTLTATFTITEYLGGVTGTFTTDSGTGGSISGTISGANVSFMINQTTPCAGTFNGTASSSNGNSRLTGSYSGTSPCTGQVSASFVVNRS